MKLSSEVAWEGGRSWRRRERNVDREVVAVGENVLADGLGNQGRVEEHRPDREGDSQVTKGRLWLKVRRNTLRASCSMGLGRIF